MKKQIIEGEFEGEVCGRDGCKGIMEKEGDGCSCHSCAPCSYCCQNAYCPECGYEPEQP